MNEELETRRPITALRRCETDLTLLRIEVRNLAAQVSGLDKRLCEYRQDLETLAVLFEREFREREERRGEHVESRNCAEPSKAGRETV